MPNAVSSTRGEQIHADVDGGLVAGPSRERVRADNRRALQQRMNDDLLGLLGRALDPEVGEGGKFLAFGPCRPDREAARR